MPHPVFSATFCSIGRRIVSSLVGLNGRTTSDEVAEQMNAHFRLNPELHYEAVSPGLVDEAVRSAAFNDKKSAYALFRGRYGGIREVDLHAEG